MKRGRDQLQEEERRDAPATGRVRVGPGGGADFARAHAPDPAAAADAPSRLELLRLPNEILGKILSAVGPVKALFSACKRFVDLIKSGDVVWKDHDVVVECIVDADCDKVERDADPATAPRRPLASLVAAARRGLLVGLRRLALVFHVRHGKNFIFGTQAGADLIDLLREFTSALARVEHVSFEEISGDDTIDTSILHELLPTSLALLSGAPGLRSLAIASSDWNSSLPQHVQWRGLLSGLSSLEALSVERASFDHSHAAGAAAALPKLRCLRASNSASYRLEHIVKALACCPCLEELRLTSFGMGEADLAHGGGVIQPMQSSLLLGKHISRTIKRLAMNADRADLTGIELLEGLVSLELHVTGSTSGLGALLRLAPRLQELRFVLGCGVQKHLEALSRVVAALPSSSKLHVSLLDPTPVSSEDLAGLIRAGQRTLRTWDEDDDRPTPEDIWRTFAAPHVARRLGPEEAAALAGCERLASVTLSRLLKAAPPAALEALGRLGARLRLVAADESRAWLRAALPQATLVAPQSTQ